MQFTFLNRSTSTNRAQIATILINFFGGNVASCLTVSSVIPKKVVKVEGFIVFFPMTMELQYEHEPLKKILSGTLDKALQIPP